MPCSAVYNDKLSCTASKHKLSYVTSQPKAKPDKCIALQRAINDHFCCKRALSRHSPSTLHTIMSRHLVRSVYAVQKTIGISEEL